MANQVHPDKRIDDLEKRLAFKDKELVKVRATLAELSRRLASAESRISAVDINVRRISRSS